MVRVMDIRGMPVISLQDGRRIGFLSAPVFDSNDCLTGFLLERKSPLPARRYIALENMLRMDKDSCVVYNESSIEKQPRKADQKSRSGYEDMLGRDVRNANGKDLGVVKDLVYSTETGSIEGLELSKGFMEDAIDGRNVVMLRDGIEVAEEFIIAGRENHDE